jgi:hypothetical protein
MLRDSRSQTGHRANDRQRALPQSGRIVPTLKECDDPAIAAGCHLFDDRAGHRMKIFGFEQEPAKWVSGQTVEAGRNEDEVGIEPVEGLVQRFLEAGAVLLGRSPRRERNVERGSDPGACARFLGGSGARVVWPLMGRQEEDGRVGVEGVLGAIAMVDVPVDYEHPFRVPHGLKPTGCHSHVVEETEAHRRVGRRVMSWRACRDERVREFACGHRAGGCDRGPGTAQRRLPRCRRHLRVGVDRSRGARRFRFRARGTNPFDLGCRVDPEQVVHRRIGCLALFHVTVQRQQILSQGRCECPQPTLVLRMPPSGVVER